jgi:anti-sigma factor RsiW
MVMTCNEILNTQAWFDGELDDATAHAAEGHAASCAECRRLLDELGETRVLIRDQATYFRADTALRARIDAALDAEEQPNVLPFRRPGGGFWRGALSGGLAMAAAAALAFFVLSPPETDELVAEVTNAHVRSLVGAHLVDFASSDPKAVGGWISSHSAVAMSSPASLPAGFRLIGARADYVYGSASAVSVFRRAGHVVNVFAWPEGEDETLPERATNKGYNIVFWKRGKMVFCAVSNISMAQLEEFSRSLQRGSA